MNCCWLAVGYHHHKICHKQMKKMLRLAFTFSVREKITSIPHLKQFMITKNKNLKQSLSNAPRFHIETYGCQMNANDSQIIRSVLSTKYEETDDESQANIILLNTCAIRESAEEKIYQRIKQVRTNKVVGILGCMAERLKEKMFQEGVHVVCGPDSYRDLPRLISAALDEDEFQMNTLLSAEETYADITPVRKNKSSVTAFLSIMRGCNNMCSFCIVPFVRGRERSRSLDTILQEIQQLESQGVKEITFLGQNVNSYHDVSSEIVSPHANSAGFREMFKVRSHPGARFADLLEQAALKFPNIRFRFTSPHPKDFPDQLLHTIGKYNNICKFIHLPAQSGNTEMLMKMRRNHTREAYLELVRKMKALIPNLALSTDLISGFCGETDEQFQETISLIKEVKYDMAFLFAYSMREKTHAHRNYTDDVPAEVKQKRLKEMIDTFLVYQTEVNQKEVGKTHLLLIEGKAKREVDVFMGKTDHFKNGYAKLEKVPVYKEGKIIEERQFKIGDYLLVKVDSVATRALYCKPIAIASTLSEFQDYPLL